MENIVLTIGGLFRSFTLGDIFFFVVTVFLMLLLIYIIYLVKLDNDDVMVIKHTDTRQASGTLNEPSLEDKPLTKIVNELETDYKPKPIDMSDYEKELEDTAIISYDELVNRTSTNIYYVYKWIY